MNSINCSGSFSTRAGKIADENDEDVSDDDDLDYCPKKKFKLTSSHTSKEKLESRENCEESKIKLKGQVFPVESTYGKKYLLKHGYKEGRGLGKHQDGIVEPVEALKQRGTRGLGFRPDESKRSDVKYDPASEVILLDEVVEWLKNGHPSCLTKNILEEWLNIGPPTKSVDSKSLFCKSEIINQILTSKNVLDSLSRKELTNGRKRSNPFESIRNAIFLNRAAMKMANLDAILNNMFTEPINSKGEKILRDNDLLYFADVCAGPGGFSEYILYRKKWRAKGFGFTLRKENDFKLDEFFAGPSESFEPHYGKREDGDIFFPENIESFKNHVFKYTNGKGVHFMMADGGVEINHDFNDQELICKKLYLCQCLMALLIVRAEGNFVVKLFDLFTSFSVGLVYLMFRSFKEITIIKPNTSRPANSERYLVCKWKLSDCGDIAEHLFKVNQKIPLYGSKAREDVLELVPSKILLQDEEFHEFIFSSNNRIGQNQIVSLAKLAYFSANEDLKEERQQELKQECLRKWNIPDTARAEPKKCYPHEKCDELLGSTWPAYFDLDIKENTIDSFDSFRKYLVSIYSWYCMVITGVENQDSCTFYLGLGRKNVHKYTRKRWMKWNQGSDAVGLCLPADTLVYAELVQECFGEGRGQRRAFAFHIIDGLFLGGEDIRSLPFKERWEACSLFAKSLCKENFPVRVKSYYALQDIDDLLRQKLVLKTIKSGVTQCVCIPVEGEDNIFWRAGGLMFITDMKDSWNRFFSSTNSLMFLDNPRTRKKYFEQEVNNLNISRDIYADFTQVFRTRKIWWWDRGVVLHDTENQDYNVDPGKILGKELCEYVRIRKKNHP